MKKKLYNLSTVHWFVVFLVSICVLMSLIVFIFYRMHKKNVLFFHVNSSSLESYFIDKKILFSNKSPVFVLSGKKIIFGSLENIAKPKPYQDVVVFDGNINDSSKKMEKYKNRNDVFPSESMGIVFDFKKERKMQDAFVLMEEMQKAVYKENKLLGSKKMPKIVFLDAKKI